MHFAHDAQQGVDQCAVACGLHFRRHLKLRGLQTPGRQVGQIIPDFGNAFFQARCKPFRGKLRKCLRKQLCLRIGSGMALRLHCAKVQAFRPQKSRRQAALALDFMHQSTDLGGQMRHGMQMAHVIRHALLVHHPPQGQHQKTRNRQCQRQHHALANGGVLQSGKHLSRVG